MQKIIAATVIALTTAAGAAHATLMTPKTVNYSCQGDKSINVTYTFNKEGLPTKAESVLQGRKRTMPINLNLSDVTGTIFGKEGTYRIDTGYVDSETYNQVTLGTVTAPNNRIIYKNCEPN